MSLQIGKAIYHLLKKDSRIKEKVGSKIYPLIVEESTTFPFIIYKRTNITPNYTKGSYSMIVFRISKQPKITRNIQA